jgi:Tol biopolymer transport system component
LAKPLEESMTIAKGTMLGPYQIEEAVGAGGMGEVYRAQDTRLDRTVAIKVLPAHLAESPELRQRLEREAKAVSSLTHPHICSLFDIGHEDGVEYLVMEFIEGETLGERLKKGALPIEELLRYGTQIADALEKAHRQGITHRDLKPGNIMLTEEGAKLLDFGLAKADDGIGGSDAELTVSPTISQPLTAAGTIVGTYHYMAPEQLEGKAVDARTDIFAFGAVLYEMATGQRAFTGGSQASLIAEVMHEMPRPASSIQPMTPPALDRVIQSCLAKDPNDRWQTAHDLKLQLQWIAEGGSVVGLPTPVSARRRSRERLAWIAAAVAAAAAVVFAVGYVHRAPDPQQQIRFQIPPPSGLGFVGSPRISPDGRFLAFRGIDENGAAQIWLRPMDSLEARPIPGAENIQPDSRPFWSPDSRHVAFFTADLKLKRIPVAGGVAQTICEADGNDGSWSVNGEILFDGADPDPLLRVAAGGGVAKPEVVVDLEGGERSVAWPEFLPDGHHFLYLLEDGEGNNKLMLRKIGEKKTTVLGETDSRVQFVEPGFLLFVKNQTLLGLPFDGHSQSVIGEPIPLVDSVSAASYGLADFSASIGGTLVFRGGTSEASARQLVWFDRAGMELGPIGEPGQNWNPWLSPSGRHVVLQVFEPDADGSDLWILDQERGVLSRFTFHAASDATPVWSPDGSRIVFSSRRGEDGRYNLYVKNASGAGEVEELLMIDGRVHPGDWTRDGDYLSYMLRAENGSWDVWALPIDGQGVPFPVANKEFQEVRASFSPDGKWIAYQSDESGREEIYVQRFPEPGGKWQISVNGGLEPFWTAGGSEITFRDQSGTFFAVPVVLSDTVNAGIPEELFESSLFPMAARNLYQVTPDGQRFLLLSPFSREAALPTSVVLNWTAGLEP